MKLPLKFDLNERVLTGHKLCAKKILADEVMDLIV
jgi:hypothetical protein